MSLVWAVVKGDLLTTAGWFVVYLGVTLAVSKWRAWRAGTTETLRAPAWARRSLSPEEKMRLARMRQRRKTLRRPRRRKLVGEAALAMQALYERIRRETRYRADPWGPE